MRRPLTRPPPTQAAKTMRKTLRRQREEVLAQAGPVPLPSLPFSTAVLPVIPPSAATRKLRYSFATSFRAARLAHGQEDLTDDDDACVRGFGLPASDAGPQPDVVVEPWPANVPQDSGVTKAPGRARGKRSNTARGNYLDSQAGASAIVGVFSSDEVLKKEALVAEEAEERERSALEGGTGRVRQGGAKAAYRQWASKGKRRCHK